MLQAPILLSKVTQPDPKIIPLPSPPGPKRWSATRHANLIRYENGTYYVYASVCGKRLQKSLHTKSETIALIRRDAEIKQARQIRANPNWKKELKFKVIAHDWARKIIRNKELKSSAKKHRLGTLQTVFRTFRGLRRAVIAKISEDQCEEWAERFRGRYSASRFNGCLESLRGVFALALKRGLIAENPCRDIKPASIRRKIKKLPTDEQFELVLKHLSDPKFSDKMPKRYLEISYHRRYTASLVVRFLAYSGRRIGHSLLLKRESVDLEAETITWPAFKHSDQPDTVPMIPQLVPVVKELVRIHPGDDSSLLPIANPRKALATCCKLAGIPRLSNHDLRHWFTTKALEAGVPVPDVALMRGDRDGGAMMLRVYSHPRIQHLRSVAKRVRV